MTFSFLAFHSPIRRTDLTWSYVQDLTSDITVIEDAEAHHVLNVLRMREGDELTLFDGRGRLAIAVITGRTRRSVTCRLKSRTQATDSPGESLTVYASPPKGERLRWMVEKLTELGVTRLVLLETTHSVVIPGESRLEKLQAAVIAACKQSRRARMMDLQPLRAFADVVKELGSGQSSGKARNFLAHPDVRGNAGFPSDQESAKEPFILHPGSESAQTADSGHCVSWETGTNLLIGPEGGFTNAELQLAREHDFSWIHWPGSVLRVETAAIVFSALLLSTMHSSPRT